MILTLAACSETPAPQGQKAANRRFAAVTRSGPASGENRFCEKTYPPVGPEARRWAPPASRPLPEAIKHAEGVGASPSWRWVNLWASWCGPCIAEMPLLASWRTALKKEGVDLSLEFWSVDENEADFVGAVKRNVPGPVRWLPSPEGRAALLSHLGVAADAAIPIHALVDSKRMIRCVRVGSVSESLYGAVRSTFRL